MPRRAGLAFNSLMVRYDIHGHPFVPYNKVQVDRSVDPSRTIHVG